MLRIGSVLDGKYEILSEVGHGGMSTVYLARNVRANKNWAIKELRKNGSSRYDIVKQNLIAETEILKRLHNPHLPSIVDVIDMDDTFVIVMDYVEGSDLGDLLKKSGAQPEKKVVEWGKQLCDVLAYLHAQEPPIIYRDMKPSNVRLRPDGMIMLLDFGTAREYKSQRAGDDTTCLGTRGYAAPEQYGGQGQTDARTDIYCLGATLYHLVTGHNPGLPPYEMKPIRELNRSLSDGLEKIIQKCTRPNPDDRYQNCAELWYDLENLADIGRKAQQKRTNKLIAFGTAVAVSLCGVLGMVGFRTAEKNRIAADYEEQIQAAKMTNDLEQKKAHYIAAASIDSARSDAYVEFLDDLTDDGAFTDGEIDALSELMGSAGDGTSSSAGVSFQNSSNKDAYVDFQYDLGQSYFFYYDSDNGLSNGIRRKARDCFSIVINSEDGTDDKALATVLYTIADATIETVEKPDQKTILGLWDALTEVVGILENDSRLSTSYVLRVYRYTVNAIGSYIDQFVSAEIEREDVAALLKRIEDLMGIENGWVIPEDRWSELSSNGENNQLIQEVLDNLQSVTDIVNVKYKN